MSFARLVERVGSALAVLSAVLIGVLAVGTTVNVLSRALLGEPIPGVIDLGSLLAVVAVFAALAEAERSESHVRVQLVTSRIPRRAARYTRALAMSICAATAALMAHATWLRAFESLAVGETQVSALRWPVWPVRLMIAAGLTLLVLMLAIKAIRYATGRQDDQTNA